MLTRNYVEENGDLNISSFEIGGNGNVMDISEQNICEILPTIEYCGTITRGEEILRVDD